MRKEASRLTNGPPHRCELPVLLSRGRRILLPLLGGLLLTFSLPSSKVFGQAGETITVTATPIPVERIPVFLSGTWYIFASGQSPGRALGGDLGGTPAPEMNTVSPVAQYIAVTGWDVVAEDAAHRSCSNNIDDNDRLGTRHGGTNSTRPTHRGVDIQANDGALVYAWQGGRLSAYPTPACGPNGVAITHIDTSKTTYCHFSQVERTSGWIRSGDLIGRVGEEGIASGPHVHITHERPDGTLVEYFTRTGTRPTQFTPRSQGGC